MKKSVPCRQTVQCSGAEHFVSLVRVHPTSSPVLETRKGSTSAPPQKNCFAARLVFLRFPIARPPCLQDSLDDRVTDDVSQPSCLPSVPRHVSESVGSLHASHRVVFSETHDVIDMHLQVAPADSNGPRAPLRSNFDDPDEMGLHLDSS